MSVSNLARVSAVDGVVCFFRCRRPRKAEENAAL